MTPPERKRDRKSDAPGHIWSPSHTALPVRDPSTHLLYPEGGEFSLSAVCLLFFRCDIVLSLIICSIIPLLPGRNSRTVPRCQPGQTVPCQGYLPERSRSAHERAAGPAFIDARPRSYRRPAFPPGSLPARSCGHTIIIPTMPDAVQPVPDHCRTGRRLLGPGPCSLTRSPGNARGPSSRTAQVCSVPAAL